MFNFSKTGYLYLDIFFFFYITSIKFLQRQNIVHKCLRILKLKFYKNRKGKMFYSRSLNIRMLTAESMKHNIQISNSTYNSVHNLYIIIYMQCYKYTMI